MDDTSAYILSKPGSIVRIGAGYSGQIYQRSHQLIEHLIHFLQSCRLSQQAHRIYWIEFENENQYHIKIQSNSRDISDFTVRTRRFLDKLFEIQFHRNLQSHNVVHYRRNFLCIVRNVLDTLAALLVLSSRPSLSRKELHFYFGNLFRYHT